MVKPTPTPERAAEKKDTSFRLLKSGKQINFVGAHYERSRDLNPLGSKDPKEFIENITKKSFVPFQGVLDSFADILKKDGAKSEVFSGFMEKNFETEIFKEIPKEYLKPAVKTAFKPEVKPAVKK